MSRVSPTRLLSLTTVVLLSLGLAACAGKATSSPSPVASTSAAPSPTPSATVSKAPTTAVTPQVTLPVLPNFVAATETLAPSDAEKVIASQITTNETTLCTMVIHVTTSDSYITPAVDDKYTTTAIVTEAIKALGGTPSDEAHDATFGSAGNSLPGLSQSYTIEGLEGRVAARLVGNSGVSVIATQSCPTDAFDEESWNAALSGMIITGLRDKPAWSAS